VSERIVGVLGGMGPEASADFYLRLTAATPAQCDQEHLRVLIDSNPKIPDRTESIRTGSEATLKALIASARLLESAGAELLVMPCNSAHVWYDQLVAELRVPFINMIEEVFLAVERAGLTRVGLLATTGTVRSGVYADAAADIVLLEPDEALQERIQEAIYRIKGRAGQGPAANLATFSGAIEVLRAQGAEGIILGCTEIPIVVKPERFPEVPIFDSTQILVEATLREALPRTLLRTFS
jgi:aspartate racemase